MATWKEDVERALESIGGIGSLAEIYDAIRRIRSNPFPPSWRAIVRRELEYNSSDSQSYKHKTDIFYSVRGIGLGVWGLRRLAI